MKVIFKNQPDPPLELWGEDGPPYFMLYRKGEKPGESDELIALFGGFPVFESKEEAELTIKAVQPEFPSITLVPVQILFEIAAASRMYFGKPVRLVKVERYTE